MSIADKLVTVAEKTPQVYGAGFSKGQHEGYTEGKADGYSEGKTEGYSEGEAAGIETGKQEAYGEIEDLNTELEKTLYGTDTGGKSHYDLLWDNLQQNGTRSQYVYTFAYTGWNDKIFNPKYPITPTSVNGISYIFQWNQQITDTKVPITAFGNCSYAFYQTAFLKRIPKLIFNGATNVSNMFYKCNALEELNAEGELTLSLSLAESTKLNKASITSLINVLSTSTSGQTLTLSKTAVDDAFMELQLNDDGTIEYYMPGSNSEEWNALISTKSNWTINLV